MARFRSGRAVRSTGRRGSSRFALMRPLAAAIAGFHAGAERAPTTVGRSGMALGRRRQRRWLRRDRAAILDPAACQRVTARRCASSSGAGAARRAAAGGFVRQCHGDLHLRNIVLLEGRPTLFDGVEFNDEIACTDVLYDLAFLLMDLWRRQLPRHANAVLNRYLSETGDRGGMSLLPLFLSCRAAVRAKTSATAARLQTEARRERDCRRAPREYLANGGTAPGSAATVPRRHRRLLGLGEVDAGAEPRADDRRRSRRGGASQRRNPASECAACRRWTGWGPRATRRTSTSACTRRWPSPRRTVVRAGYAPSPMPSTRDRRGPRRHRAGGAAGGRSAVRGNLARCARSPRSSPVPNARRHDASDADAAVIRTQLSQDTGSIDWHRLDASGAAPAVFERGLACLKRHVPHALNGHHTMNGVTHALA